MKLTRRQWHLNELHNAPLDAELAPIPKARARTKGEKREWHLQASCVKLIRERMRLDKRLRFICADPAHARTPQQALFAKMAGLEKGIPDIVLVRVDAENLRLACVELKMPGKELMPEQIGWFNYFMHGGVRCDRVDNVGDFARVLDEFMR